MPNYRDHLLFGSVLVLIFSYFMGPFMAYSMDAVIVSAAFILLAAIFPDIDHKGSIVHQRMKALVVILVTAVPVGAAYPDVPVMITGGTLTAVGTYYTFGLIKPKHRKVTHTFKFAVLFSATVGVFALVAFNSFLPAIFSFIAYLSHLVLDGTFQ